MQDVTPAPEEWRAVVGYKGEYEVSDFGRVRSLDRMVPLAMPYGTVLRRTRGRILKATPSGKGYLMVQVGRKPDGTRNMCYVHILVAEAFHGPRPGGMEVCHGPGGKTDNRAVNLSWGTKSKNCGEDALRDGTLYRGEQKVQAKLTWEAVREIRRRRAAGESIASLARAFGVGRTTVHHVVAGDSWRHDPDRPEFRREAS